ncbi:MAG: hypothetical protein QGH33_14290, partial [Pirellulaceae bacterium]|nr:hypothetical protein [Pirellulaceae bacterium]
SLTVAVTCGVPERAIQLACPLHALKLGYNDLAVRPCRIDRSAAFLVPDTHGTWRRLNRMPFRIVTARFNECVEDKDE